MQDTPMPQLEFGTYPGQAFWLAASFFLLYFLMAKVVLPRLRSILQQRAFRLENDLEKAEEFKKEAEAILKEYETVLSEARANAKALTDDAHKKADADARLREAEIGRRLKARVEESHARIRQLKEDAVTEMDSVKSEMVDVIFRKVIRARS
jgi:F-type H+-transporting ATPase subunit b